MAAVPGSSEPLPWLAVLAAWRMRLACLLRLLSGRSRPSGLSERQERAVRQVESVVVAAEADLPRHFPVTRLVKTEIQAALGVLQARMAEAPLLPLQVTVSMDRAVRLALEAAAAVCLP